MVQMSYSSIGWRWDPHNFLCGEKGGVIDVPGDLKSSKWLPCWGCICDIALLLRIRQTMHRSSVVCRNEEYESGKQCIEVL